MAKVTKTATVDTRTVSQFWPRYQRRALKVLLGIQLITSLAGILILSSTGFINIVDPLTAFIAISSITLGLCGSAVAFAIITSPLHALASALRYAADEPGSEQIPAINPKRDPDGIAPLLATIYAIPPAGQTVQETKNTEKDNPDISRAIAALNATNTGIALLSEKGTLLYANSSTPTNVTSDGTMILQLLPETLEDIKNWLARQGNTSIKNTNSWKRVPSDLPDNQERRFFDIYAQYSNQNAAPLVLTFVDRTDDYEPEEKDLNFISFAAHELRGPITVIRGYVDTLHTELQDKLAPDQNMLFERLTVSSNRLSSYVNNILNAAKYDRRHLKVYLHEDTVANIYASIADDMALRASTHGRLLNVSIPTNLPTIPADRTSLGEVISNLIDNAIKYSSEGGTITVTATTSGSSVHIEVADQGIGMPANVVENLFTKFYRSHRSRETVSGTGIGLYICKAIVESHGGTIDVRSVEGEGSIFSVTLPIYASVADKLAANKQSSEALIEQRGGWIKNHGKIRG